MTVYLCYRLLLAFIFTILATPYAQTLSPIDYNNPFYLYSTFTLFLSSFCLFALKPKVNIKPLLLPLLIIDIVCISIISHASGGISNGFPALLLATVAFSNIFFRGITSYFIAAISAISILFSVTLFALDDPDNRKYFIPSGVMSIIFFLEALILQSLVRSIEKANVIAIEEQVKSRNLEELNSLIVERLNIGVVVFDKALNIILINQKASELLSIGDTATNNPNEILTKAYKQWLNKPQDQYIVKALNNLKELNIQFSYVDAAKNQLIAFIEDYSNLQQQAQLLKLSSLGRLSASIAHEIRNPLTAISQASQLLHENTPEESPDYSLLNMILNNTKRIDKIIENTSNIAKRKPAHQESLNLLSCVNTAIESIQQQRNATIEAHISINKEATVIFDESQLTQILHNLINNALDFSHLGTNKYSVAINSSKQQSITALQIIDNGPGISNEDQQYIFEPFFSKRQGGTGLGLYICKELCELNRANISFSRTESGKSCFTIQFATNTNTIHLEA